MQSNFRGGILASIMLSCLLAACGGGSGGSSNTPPSPTRTVSIDVKQPWTDTGLAVTAGQQQSISASGTLNWRSNSQCILTTLSCTTTPAGDSWSTCATLPPPAYVAPGLACWSLLGKIGANGTPFEVGDSLQLTDNVTGELFLGVNDNVFSDNTGAWSVVIKQL